MEVSLHPAPLPEAGSRVDLIGAASGPWSAVVDVGRDGVITLAATTPEGERSMPVGWWRLTMAFVSRGIPWEVPVKIEAAPDGGPATSLTARPVGAARPSRRRAVRVPVSVAVAARVGEGESGLGSVAVTRNLSVNGALLAVAEAIEVGRLLRIEMMAADGTLALRGTVVRCDPEPGDECAWRVAVAFDDLEQDQGDRLRRFLRRAETRIAEG